MPEHWMTSQLACSDFFGEPTFLEKDRLRWFQRPTKIVSSMHRFKHHCHIVPSMTHLLNGSVRHCSIYITRKGN
ncbi:unnamed protein product [Ixodes persulcatus]